MNHSSHHSTPSKLPPQLYITIPEFLLESGEILTNAVIAFTFHGLLNARGDNAVVVCHALSGSAAVEEWWPSLITGPNPPLDSEKYCVVCCNSLGSPYGSSSPLTYRSADKQAKECYGPDFPNTTIRDDVRAHKYVLDILGVKSVQYVIGPSMGGMLALEWSFFGIDYVRALVLIATAARQCAWQIAWNMNQRNTINCDAKFREGRYGSDPPQAGLAAARMAALMTYRSPYSFMRRFGRGTNYVTHPVKRLSDNKAQLAGDSISQVSPKPIYDIDVCKDTQDVEENIFSVQRYLRYQGDKFNARFDANCYIHILEKMDTHDITRGRIEPTIPADEALKKILVGIRQPTLVVGIPSDGLYTIEEQQMLYQSLPNSVFGIIDSREGHDAFLIETEQLADLLHTFFDRRAALEVDEKGSDYLNVGKDAVIVWAGSF